MSDTQPANKPASLKLKKSPGPNRPRKMPAIKKHSTKSDGFAIGVTASHYWTITALAEGKKSNRMAVLEEVIDHYIKTKLLGQEVA